MLEGNKLLQDGDAAGALKKFEEAKSMIKEDRQAPLWMQIGKAQAKLNQEEAAIAAYKKSLELAPAITRRLPESFRSVLSRRQEIR